MRKISLLAASVALLVLVGAGCTSKPKVPTAATNEQPPAAAKSEEKAFGEGLEKEIENVRGAIRLEGRGVGDNEAQFSWLVSTDITNPEKFLLVRSEAENPVHDGKNFWFKVQGSNRNIIWNKLPAGPWNFRICLLVNDTCTIYSNNVFVQVKE